jgi:nucleotide-binding universal stress UspA family protein
MTDAAWPAVPPSRILVATDLSAQADRAADRAAQLARIWNAELVVLHALEEIAPWRDTALVPSWQSPPDLAARIERQLREDFADLVPVEVRIVERPAAEAVLTAVKADRCDLIVVGEGRHRPMGGLGATLSELFRSAPVSVLVAKQRVRGPYRRLLVGTDYTDEALIGFETAAQLFPAASFTLMHAFELPYRSLMADNRLGRDFQSMERETIDAFVRKARLPESVRGNVETLVEHGPPSEMLFRYGLDHQVDLTVIGAYERGRLFHALLGGEGPRILESVTTDILVVRPPSGDDTATI